MTCRYGHVAWYHKGRMWMFGGSSLAREVPQNQRAYCSDLWALSLVSWEWTEVKASGIHPSPRADMGKVTPHTA